MPKLDVKSMVENLQKQTQGSPLDGLKAKAGKQGESLSNLKEKKMQDLKKRKEEEARKKAEKMREGLKPNEKLLTDFTNGKLPVSGINYVINVYPDDHFPKEVRAAIPEIDKKFIWNPNDLEALIIGKKTGQRVGLIGDPGTGKTTSANQFAAILRQPFFQFNGKEGIEYSSFLGSTGVRNGQTQWFDGVFTEAMKVGALCCIDEVMKIPPGVQMALQTIYQRGGHILLDDKEGSYEDKMVVPREEFFLVLTDNVSGGGEKLETYASTSVQDASFIDRIGLVRRTTYLPKDVETQLLIDAYGASSKDANTLVKFAGLVRNGFSQGAIGLTLSPRGLEAICESLKLGLPLNVALGLSYINKLPSDGDVQAAKGFLSSIGVEI